MKGYAAAYLLSDEELCGSGSRDRVEPVTPQPLAAYGRAPGAPATFHQIESDPQPGPNGGRKGFAGPAARWATPRVNGDGCRPWAAGARELVKLHLKRLGTATVAELAASIGTLSAGAIGPRLTELDQLGHARWWRVKPRGPGQPKKVWTLT